MKRRFSILAFVLATVINAYAFHGYQMPDSLQEGDKVAIVSPSYGIDREDVERARLLLEEQGWEVEVMPHALSHHGYYAGSDSERLEDLKRALTDPDIKAVICSRGGYGAVHILQQLDSLYMRVEPKWLVGFSDVTALHALMNRFGIMSIHGPMPITFDSDEESTALLMEMLKGRRHAVEAPANEWNRKGKARGTLVGGNFAVMAHLLATPFDMIKPGSILFIEEVDEPIYKVERVLWQLRLSGVLEQLSGLVVGEFSGWKHNPGYSSMEQMIRQMVEPYDFPVMFGTPIGHGKVNHPVIESAEVELSVTDEGGVVRYVE